MDKTEITNESYECQAPKCSNRIEIGFFCDECGRQFLEDIKLMTTPPSLFWRCYDFIATKIDNLMFAIEYIHDKRLYRKNNKKGENYKL